MATATLAPAYTLLGKLQRGLGAGFLEALRIEPAAAHELLLACLAEDPRREESEARGRYYGELCLQTRIDLGDLAALVESADERPEARRLVLETVGWLAWRRVGGPISILRQYVASGGAETALALSFLWHPRAFAGLDAALLARYPTPEALREALAAVGATPFAEPWRTWSAAHPELAAVLEEPTVTDAPEPVPPLPRSDDPFALVEELRVALEHDECVCEVSRALVAATDDALPLLERAFRQTSRSSCRVTMARALARTSETFPRRAAESLWDAEPEVVGAAADVVALDAPGVHDRLATLARDGLPAARARLAVD